MSQLSLTIPYEYPTDSDFSNKSSKKVLPSYSYSNSSTSNLFNFKVKDAKGYPVSLRNYTGKKAYIVVNTFPSSAFRKLNYKELQSIYDLYQDDLEILAFPCCDFVGEEMVPASPASKKQQDAISFPVFGTIHCSVEQRIHPLYEYLTKSAPVRYAPVEWDFVKFLCDANGKVVARYPPEHSPKDMEADIQELINDELNVYRAVDGDNKRIRIFERKKLYISSSPSNEFKSFYPSISSQVHHMVSPISAACSFVASPLSIMARRVMSPRSRSQVKPADSMRT